MVDLQQYRPCVGIVLYNKEGKIFLAQRIDNPGDYWQMPQGGIDEGESVIDAAFREMEEETGTRNATFIAEHDEWLHYDLPEHLARKLWNGQYKGQKQKWVALSFDGDDSDFDLNTFDPPEFSSWMWAEINDIANLAVPFKNDVYHKVIKYFRNHTDLKSA